MSSYRVALYHPDYDEGIVALRHLSWSSDPRAPQRFLAWKYHENPYFPDPLLFVALQDDTVVGMRGAYGTCWEAGNATRVLLPAADDFAILPDHRNTGVATLIMRALHESLVERGFSHVLALSAGRVTALQSLAMGWKSAGAMEPLVLRDRRHRAATELNEVLRRTRGLWRLAKRDWPIVDAPGAPFQRLDAAGTLPTPEAGATITAHAVPPAESMAALVARLPWDGRMRQVRDAAFFQWRYRNPAREYRFVCYERNGVMEGYLVLARFPSYRPPMLPFHIVDWEGTTADVRAELLRAALRTARIPELGAWNAGVHAEDRALLAAEGFRPTDMESRRRGLPCVMVRALGESPDWTLGGRQLTEAAEWDMRLVYSMHG